MLKHLLFVVCLYWVGAAVADQSLSLRTYLNQLSEDEGFELSGTNVIAGSDTASIREGVDVDRALTHALRQYNFVVSYAGGRVSRVWITGRKGASTGPMPEAVEAAVAEALDETTQ